MAQIDEIARAVMRDKGAEIAVTHATSGISFLTKPGAYTELLSAAVSRVTGYTPEQSTSGGTSDARFIKDHCPVTELGLPGRTMHKTDECVRLEDIEILTRIYLGILEDYFAKPPLEKGR